MNQKEALTLLASQIFDRGPSKFVGQLCLVPWYFRKYYEHLDERPSDVPDIVLAHDLLAEEHNVTHYDLRWVEKGKSVLIRLYAADEFGGAIVKESMCVLEEIITL